MTILRLAAICILTMGPLLIAITYHTTLLRDGNDAQLGALQTLTLALWSGWIALALYPGVLAAYCVLSFFPDAPQELVPATCCLIWACTHLLSGRTERMGYPSHGMVVSCVTMALFAGFLYLPGNAGPTWIIWTAREVLGALFVLILIRRCRRYAHLSAGTALKLQHLLFAGVLLSCLSVIVLQPNDIHVEGIAGAFLSFGLVPPLFLPFLFMPIRIASMKFETAEKSQAPRGQV